MMLLEYKRKILIVDIGLGFPEEDMPGIDCIIPNVNYLKDKQKNILGVLITHGHYDHIGAIPYMIERIGNPPIFTSALSRGIILKRQEDFPHQPKLDITTIKNGEKIGLGPFNIEPFRQNHNIPGNLGFFIKAPVGNILITSDFKFDENPVNELPTDFKKLKELGKRGILLLISDSTNAEEAGHSFSEKKIEQNLDEIFEKTKGRIIAATFSSLLNRVQQIIALSEKYGRRVCIEGYSMKTNVEIARNLNYLKIKKGTLIKTKDISNYSDSKITVMCTGAQGEGRAVLMRIANNEHKFIHLKKGDTIIFSSYVVPGNERTVQVLKDEFYRRGTKVFHYKMMDIHAGGHAQQEELNEMIEMGIGDVGEIVLRDRQMLAKDGMFVIVVVVDKQTGRVKGSPDIISRGFIYLRGSKDLLAQTRRKVINIVNKAAGSGGAVNWAYVKDEIRNKLGQFLFSKTQRRPIILSVVIEV